MVKCLLFLIGVPPKSLRVLSKMLGKHNQVGSLDVPGARWPGAVMANAFIIHGLRPESSFVDPMVIVVCSDISRLRCSKLPRRKDSYLKYADMHHMHELKDYDGSVGTSVLAAIRESQEWRARTSYAPLHAET